MMTAPSPVDVFTARAQARALLWHCGVFSLVEAIDVLQADAERDGLAAAIGADAVQKIIAAAFAIVRDDLPPPPPDMVPDEITPTNERERVARSTLDAAEQLIREGNLDQWRKWFDARTAKERAVILRHLEQRERIK